MNGAPSKCPNPQCGCPVLAADAFCPSCGQGLTATAGPAAALADLVGGNVSGSADASSPQELAGASEMLPSLPTQTSPARAVAGPESESLATPPHPVGSAAEVSGEAPPQSDCADLEVRYNNSCVFVLNMQSTFDFEIRPRMDGLRDLFVEVRQSGQVIARETPTMLPKRGVALQLGLNYTPRNTHAGKVSFEIRVGFRKDQQRHAFAVYRTHTIYSGKEDPRQVCESLVVEVKNNIQQGHAGDVRVDQSFDGLREALRDRSTIALDREFLQLINTRPFWTVLPLGECAEESAGGSAFLRRARPLQPIVLRSAEGLAIHLLPQSPVRIGRAKDCEIVARAFDTAGKQLNDESLRIGRYHASLEWQDNQCQILDRGYYADEKRWRSSSTGVWIDGRRMTSGQAFTFAPAHEYRITLAEPAADKAVGFELAARLWLVKDLPRLRAGCPDLRATPEAPACLILRRLQSPAETFVLLRQAVSLAWVDDRCAAACVCLREQIMHFSDGHGCDGLMPGKPVRAGKLDFRVAETKTN